MRRSLLLVLLVVGGCKARDVDLLVQVSRRAAQKFEAGFGITPDVLAGRIQGPLEETGLAGRVRLRLHFDRHAQDVSIQISSPSPGVVRLRATVPDAATRQRILELTRSTTGVEQVIDEMTLAADE